MNHFPLASEAAKKAVVAPIRRPFGGSRAVNMNKPRYIIYKVNRFCLLRILKDAILVGNLS